MRAVSNTYKQIIASGETRNYVVTINMTLADNTSLTITDADIMDNSFKVFSASSGTDSFDIGAAIIGKCQFTLKNFDDTWTEYDFFDAEATVWVGLVGDINNGTQIYHRLGFFTVDDPQFAGSLISLELLDNMWKFDYDLPSIPLPSSIGDIVNRLCTHCGVILASQSFNGHDITISALPEKKMNCRELLQYLAMLGCNFCVMNDQGALALKWYDTASRPSDNYDGGSFSTSTTPYSDGDNIDGGNFTYYKGKKKYDGGTFTDNSNLGYLTRLFSRNIGTDIITVTGLKIKIGETNYLVGNEGYVLVIENPLITEDNVSSMLSRIWQRLQSFTFRTFNVTVLPDLALEVGDCVAISYKGNMVYSFLTNLTFTPSLTTASLGAVTPTRTLTQRYSKAVETAVEVARQRVDKQLGTYDLMAQRMNQLAINAMGAYTDYDDMPTGGRIYYLSNAPITKNAETGLCEFPDSAVVYKTTGDGFFISTSADPQTHQRIWTQGFSPSTGLLVEMLTALRINCEQLYTGLLTVGGSQTGVTKPYIRVLDENNNPIVYIDYRGITMHKGLLQSPDYEEEDPVGTYAASGMAIDVNNATMKSEYFAINALGAFLKGTIEASGGHIGAATITQNAITIRGDIDLYDGSGTFQFRPTDYYFVEDFPLLLKCGNSFGMTLTRERTWVFDGFSDDKTALRMHGLNASDWEYIMFQVNGLNTSESITVSFRAKFADNTSFIDSNEWVLGVVIDAGGYPVNREAELGNRQYIRFEKDSQWHNYTLTFTPNGSTQYVWFQFTGINDGTSSSIDIRDFYIIGAGATSNVTLKLHQNGSDTVINTYTVDAVGVQTEYLNHLIGTNNDDYYELTISNKTNVAAKDVLLAYMGEEGFLGTLRGIFEGYIESNSGRIAGIKYTSGGYFYGTDAQLINTYGYGGHESRLKIASGSFGSTDIKPNITRTYTEDGDTKNSSVLWDDANVAYRNEIQYHRNIGVGTGTPADPSGDLYPADGTVFFKHNGTEITNLYAAVGGQFLEYLSSNVTYGTDEPTGGNDGDAYIQLSSDLKISYVSADQAWTHERFIYNNSKITGMVISGHGTGGNDIIAYKLTGLVPDAEVTINFTAQITSGSPVYYNRYPNGAYADNAVSTSSRNYVAFTQGTTAHNYSLSFTPSSSEAYFWIQLADINDNYTITLDITNLTFQGAVGGSGIKALWVNENGTWQSGYFGGSGGDVFIGATASQAGAKGLVPAPSAGDQNKFLRGDGTWHTVGGGGGSYSKTLLWGSSTITHPASLITDITLNDSWSNYDAIMFVTGFSQSNIYPIEIFTIDTDILDMLPYTTNANGLVYAHNQNSNAGQWVRVCKGQSGNNTLHMFYSGNAGLYQVYGINY